MVALVAWPDMVIGIAAREGEAHPSRVAAGGAIHGMLGLVIGIAVAQMSVLRRKRPYQHPPRHDGVL